MWNMNIEPLEWTPQGRPEKSGFTKFFTGWMLDLCSGLRRGDYSNCVFIYLNITSFYIILNLKTYLFYEFRGGYYFC